ncbi:hypothetical protein EJB05_05192, partial [Eragrostis curvula]
ANSKAKTGRSALVRSFSPLSSPPHHQYNRRQQRRPRALTFPPRHPLPRYAMTTSSSSSSSRKALSKIACIRLQKELAEWQMNPPAEFKHKVTDNLQRCPLASPSLRLITKKGPGGFLYRFPFFVTLFSCEELGVSVRLCEIAVFIVLVFPLAVPWWVVEVAGAPGTLYAGETYQLQVDFPEHYPMEAPQVIFLHPTPMHPHIYSNGHICLGIMAMFYYILYDSWSPAMTVSSVCISILSMLSSSPAKQRPADNDHYVRNCRSGRSPKETRWWFHDDKV